MLKFIVVVLATCAAMAIAIHLVGSGTLAQTAVTVPGTQHTHPFGISWYLIVGSCIGFSIWRVIKGK